MMKKIMMLMLASIFLVTLMPINVSAEVYMWNSVIINQNDDIVRYHAYYQFEDTSERSIGRNKDIPVTFTYVVEAIPYNLSGYGGEVDWCNLTINSFHNIYDKEGFLINTSTETQNVYFGTGNLSTDSITINVRDADDIIADMDCHYTNSSTLYVEHALIGRFDTFIPSFQCTGCEKYTLEELSDEIERSKEITENELRIYEITQVLMELNYKLWTIISWIVKLFFLLVALWLVFASIYWLYKYFDEIARAI